MDEGTASPRGARLARREGRLGLVWRLSIALGGIGRRRDRRRSPAGATCHRGRRRAAWWRPGRQPPWWASRSGSLVVLPAGALPRGPALPLRGRPGRLAFRPADRSRQPPSLPGGADPAGRGGPALRAARWPWPSWTWTASSRSTTEAATRTAIARSPTSATLMADRHPSRRPAVPHRRRRVRHPAPAHRRRWRTHRDPAAAGLGPAASAAARRRADGAGLLLGRDQRPARIWRPRARAAVLPGRCGALPGQARGPDRRRRLRPGVGASGDVADRAAGHRRGDRARPAASGLPAHRRAGQRCGAGGRGPDPARRRRPHSPTPGPCSKRAAASGHTVSLDLTCFEVDRAGGAAPRRRAVPLHQPLPHHGARRRSSAPRSCSSILARHHFSPDPRGAGAHRAGRGHRSGKVRERPGSVPAGRHAAGRRRRRGRQRGPAAPQRDAVRHHQGRPGAGAGAAPASATSSAVIESVVALGGAHRRAGRRRGHRGGGAGRPARRAGRDGRPGLPSRPARTAGAENTGLAITAAGAPEVSVGSARDRTCDDDVAVDQRLAPLPGTAGWLSRPADG